MIETTEHFLTKTEDGWELKNRFFLAKEIYGKMEELWSELKSAGHSKASTSRLNLTIAKVLLILLTEHKQ